MPTSGTALIGGYDIRNEIENVHLLTGVCPQFSTLWEDLTVKEHLEFFARLKGVPLKEEKEHVQKALVDFGLDDVQDRLSEELSGGMKRRLSIAISLVGDSKIIFLDEPVSFFSFPQILNLFPI